MAALAAGVLGTAGGAEGLRTLELAIRTAMQRLSGALLGDLLSLDAGHRGPRVDCGRGHRAAWWRPDPAGKVKTA